jgi:hypothetical protein
MLKENIMFQSMFYPDLRRKDGETHKELDHIGVVN